MTEQLQRVIPMLAYEDGVKALTWLCDVFGFVEKTRWLDDNGQLAHGEIEMGGAKVMLAQPSTRYQSPAHHRAACPVAAAWSETPYIINGVLIYVDDVEAHFATAKARGATILSGLEYGGPGTRYRAEDLEGQRWMFMQIPQ